MPDDYHQIQRIHNVQGDANYHFHEAPHHKPFRPGRWAWVGGITALLALGGYGATTHLSAKVYYCASHNAVKYHTDATCPALKQCSTTVKSIPLSQARSKMDLCKVCHSK